MFIIYPISIAIVTLIVYFWLSGYVFRSIPGRIVFGFVGVVIWFVAESILIRTPWIQRMIWSGPDRPAILTAMFSAAGVALFILLVIVAIWRRRDA